MIIDEQQIRLWFSTFKNDERLTEVRLIKKGNKAYSGYFTNVETIINELSKFPDDYYQCYFTLNDVNPSCYGKTQHDKLMAGVSTTGDDQITKRTTLLIDFDPVRVSDTSSTNAMIKEAASRALRVESFLKEYGFPDAIRGLSGNGCHLLYDLDLPNTDDIRKVIKRFYDTLSGLFTDNLVDIDKSVFNASRISKIFGTYARKGANIESTPHRLSKITTIPKERKLVDLSSLINVANLLPSVEEQKSLFRNELSSGIGVDVDGFLQKHNIAVAREETYQGGRKIVLEHCVFNEDHKAPDAVIFVSREGIPNYHCSHNSCADKNGWRNFREFFEPDYYQDKEKRNEEYKQTRRSSNTYQQFMQEDFRPIEFDESLGNKWLTFSDIEYLDTSKMPVIKTGFTALDSQIVGLYLGELSIVTGINASGKSSWLNHIALNAIEQGNKVAIWSGELESKRLKPWICQTAAGPRYVTRCTEIGKENFYYVSDDIDRKVTRWLGDKLYIYNNDYGFRWEQIRNDLNDMMEAGVKLFILDNLMAMSLVGFKGDGNEKQKALVLELKQMAKKYGVHIILVAHPRKEVTFIRKESISGSGDLSNIVDNILIVHRVNQDFEKRAAEFLGADKTAAYCGYSNVVEVAKNRSEGKVDVLAGLYFDARCRRFQNVAGEVYSFGWETYTGYSEQSAFNNYDNYLTEENRYHGEGELPF